MRLTAGRRSDTEGRTPLLALLVDDGRPDTLPGGELGRRAAGLLKAKRASGARRKTLLLHAESAGGPRALLLVGLGKAREAGGEDYRRGAAIAVNQAAELGADALVIAVAGGLAPDAAALAALGEGAVLATYRYPLKKAETTPPKRATVVADVAGAAGILRGAQALGDAANLARELQDLPGNRCTPRHLARTAQAVARKGRLRCRVHGKAALKKMKMGGILAVNQGSAEEPFLIEMEYSAGRPKRTICVVGKGLTFDAGGISIKPAEKMEDMKYDMSGGAATIGVMAALAALKPKDVRVIGIVGTTENVLGPAGYKPGDIVVTASGRTIEVVNTDAEGRIVLADALHHATKFRPDAIIDMATLTGAIVVALGDECAGLFCRDDALARRLESAAQRTGERLWRMPTYDEYEEKIKSRWADIKNSGGRSAGSCTAARFLFHFTGDIPHAHIDIAGTAWDGRARDWHSTGGTGFGVRLVYDAVTRWDD